MQILSFDHNRMRLQTLNIDLESNQQEPVIFLKPTSSYLESGGTIEIPYPLDSLYHEVELAVVIAKKARDVPESTAMEYVGGIMIDFRSMSLNNTLLY